MTAGLFFGSNTGFGMQNTSFAHGRSDRCKHGVKLFIAELWSATGQAYVFLITWIAAHRNALSHEFLFFSYE